MPILSGGFLFGYRNFKKNDLFSYGTNNRRWPALETFISNEEAAWAQRVGGWAHTIITHFILTEVITVN